MLYITCFPTASTIVFVKNISNKYLINTAIILLVSIVFSLRSKGIIKQKILSFF